MPPLRLPFLQPTQPTGGLGIESMSPELQELLGIIQQPLPDVKKPSTGQKVAAGLSDALLSAANVLSRGAAPEPQAGARLKAEEAASREQRSQVESRNAGLRQQAALSTFQSAQAEKRRLASEQALLDRQAANDLLIAERQRADDQRAEEATQKKLALTEWSELLELPGFKAPPGFDIATATLNDVMRVKQQHYASLTGDPRLGAMLATLDSLIKERPELKDFRKQFQISAEGKVSGGLTEPTEKEQRNLTASGLTPAQLINLEGKLGESLEGLSRAEIGKKVAALGAEKLKWYNFGEGELDRYTNWHIIRDKTRSLLERMEKSGVGGASTMGFATSQEAADFRAEAANINDLIKRTRTGSAANAFEEKSIQQFTVVFGNLLRNNISAANEVIDFYTRKIGSFEGAVRMPESQKRSIRLGMAGADAEGNVVPIEVPPGWVEQN